MLSDQYALSSFYWHGSSLCSIQDIIHKLLYIVYECLKTVANYCVQVRSKLFDNIHKLNFVFYGDVNHRYFSIIVQLAYPVLRIPSAILKDG